MKSPFKFLDSFTKEDHDIFFGRDKEVELIHQKAIEKDLLLIYGVSGTGKTSLVNCGLANSLNDSDWLPVHTRRGTNINESLFDNLQKAAKKDIQENYIKNKKILRTVKSVYLDYFRPVYLIFDQFEELFIFGTHDEKKEFLNHIYKIVKSDLECKIIFILREEYLAGLSEFEELIPDIFENRIRVEKMTRANAKQAIEGPCKVHKIVVEEGFSEQLLEKLSPDSTEVELTYLQVFLDKLYRKATGEPKQFTNDLLGQMGNVSDLLGSFLEEQITQAKNPDETLAILKSFVSVKGTKRQITEDEILSYCQAIGNQIDKNQIKTELQNLVNLRILRDKDENSRYELRHDALASKIYEKITLVEKELMEVRQFIENAFANYQKRKVLLSKEDLGYIAPYEDKIIFSKEQYEYIKLNKSHTNKLKKRKRNIAIISSILLISVLSGFSIWALNAKKIAERQLYKNLEGSLTISANRLNVLYYGIANPVRIASPGISEERIFPYISKGKGQISGEYGQFEVSPKEWNGGFEISAIGVTYKGDSINLGTIPFRIKYIPDPIPHFEDEVRGKINKMHLIKDDAKLEVELKNFVFDLRFIVKAFSISIKDTNDKTITIHSNNNKINSKQRELIKELKTGNKIYFENIKALGPDGRIMNLKSFELTII